MPRAWVIGGKRGIGRAVTTELVKQLGPPVHVTDEYDCNVRSRRDLQRYFKSTSADYIVYCAGINKLMPAAEFDEVTALDIMDVNCLGFMNLISVIAASKDHKPQSVVAISSDASWRPMRNSMAYCASKAALSMAVKCAARELAPAIRINAVAPSIVDDTPMTEDIDKQVADVKGWTMEQVQDSSAIPMQRRAHKEEIAALIYSVLTGPQYLTGSIVDITGGK